jgi:hypothetical protein
VTISKPTEPRPTVDDRELMRLLDGELDDDMAADIEARLEDDEQARAKLAGLERVGSVVRELIDGDERGDSIVAAVMSRIDAETEDDGAADDDASGDEPLPALPRIERGKLAADVGGPANDNARTIYAIAVAAAAVAAGLFFYSRTSPETVAQAPAPVVAERTAVAPAAPPATARVAEQADDDEPEVEIAAVDFGSRSGSVFYISGGKNTAASTAVLWVSDSGE